MTVISIHKIHARDVPNAIEAVKKARFIGLAVWYLPKGGTDDIHDEPIVHRVIVRGDSHLVEAWRAYEKHYV